MTDLSGPAMRCLHAFFLCLLAMSVRLRSKPLWRISNSAGPAKMIGRLHLFLVLLFAMQVTACMGVLQPGVLQHGIFIEMRAAAPIEDVLVSYGKETMRFNGVTQGRVESGRVHFMPVASEIRMTWKTRGKPYEVVVNLEGKLPETKLSNWRWVFYDDRVELVRESAKANPISIYDVAPRQTRTIYNYLY